MVYGFCQRRRVAFLARDLCSRAQEKKPQLFRLLLSLALSRRRRCVNMADDNRRVPSNNQAHWDARYANSADAGLSWSEGPDSLSLKWILEVAPEASSIVDVGAGRSTLLPTLLTRGYTQLTHVDWSESASLSLQRSLGYRATRIKWVVDDLLEWQPGHPIDLWHDRAVFHFQVDLESINSYLESLHRNVRQGGYFLIATFHLDGPKECSGLPVKRYCENSILAVLGSYSGVNWIAVRSAIWKHVSPDGIEQNFQYLLAKRG